MHHLTIVNCRLQLCSIIYIRWTLNVLYNLSVSYLIPDSKQMSQEEDSSMWKLGELIGTFTSKKMLGIFIYTLCLSYHIMVSKNVYSPNNNNNPTMSCLASALK